MPPLPDDPELAAFLEEREIDRLHLPFAALKHLAALVRSGQLKHREDISQGIENAPRTFIGMLRGENFGKTQVQLGPDPFR